MKSFAFFAASLFALFLLQENSNAQTLFGTACTSGGNSGDGTSECSLYTINPGTGAGTLIGPIGFDGVTGLACLNDGRFVGSARDSNETNEEKIAILIEIDTNTGVGALIGTIDNSTDGCGRMPDITYDSSTNTLYGWGDRCNGAFTFDQDTFYTINTQTGAGTQVGPTGVDGSGNGIAIDPGTGTIFAFPSFLYTVNPITGVASIIPGTNPFALRALAFQPGTGILFGVRSTAMGDLLVTVNTTNGNINEIGQAPENLDAIIFDCVEGEREIVIIPTMGQWGKIIAIVLIGFFAIIGLRRRIKS